MQHPKAWQFKREFCKPLGMEKTETFTQRNQAARAFSSAKARQLADDCSSNVAILEGFQHS